MAKKQKIYVVHYDDDFIVYETWTDVLKDGGRYCPSGSGATPDEAFEKCLKVSDMRKAGRPPVPSKHRGYVYDY